MTGLYISTALVLVVAVVAGVVRARRTGGCCGEHLDGDARCECACCEVARLAVGELTLKQRKRIASHLRLVNGGRE